MKRRMKGIEPWMFGATVTVNGREVHAEIGRFTLLGRIRMALRRLQGKPAWQVLPLADEDLL